MNKYGGKVFFLNRDNINTDEIIPAKYLTEIDRMPLKPHLFEDLKIEGFNPNQLLTNKYNVIVSRANFGCGSSREMAVWALSTNSINVIIASNFARIFYENAFNDGVLAIELNPKIIEDIFNIFQHQSEVEVDIDLTKMNLTFKSQDKSKNIPFNLTSFQKDLIVAGGWIPLAAKKY